MNPWICPKCNRVYAPFVFECKNCNKLIDIKEENKDVLDNKVLLQHQAVLSGLA